MPPLELPAAGQVTPADLIALRLPIGLVGYSTQAVDETLHRVSVALGERDTRIAVLEQRVAELSYARPQTREETTRLETTRPETTRPETRQPETQRFEAQEPEAADVRAERVDAEEAW